MVLGSYFFTRPKKHISEYDFRHVMAILCISLCTLSAGDTRYGRWSAGVPVEGQRVFLARAGGGRNRRVAPHLSAPHQGGALWVILLSMYSKLLLILDPEDPFELGYSCSNESPFSLDPSPMVHLRSPPPQSARTHCLALVRSRTFLASLSFTFPSFPLYFGSGSIFLLQTLLICTQRCRSTTTSNQSSHISCCVNTHLKGNT